MVYFEGPERIMLGASWKTKSKRGANYDFVAVLFNRKGKIKVCACFCRVLCCVGSSNIRNSPFFIC